MNFSKVAIVVGEGAGIDHAEGDADGAGEGGCVNEVGCAESACVGETVGQDEAALGVGVDDVDGLAGPVGGYGHCGHHVAGFVGFAVGHVLCGADDGDDAHFGLEQGDGAHGAEHGRAAGHVVLHLLHVVGGLDGDAAGVEGDAFADQAEDWAVFDAFGFVAQDDERGRLGGALGDAREGTHFQLAELIGRVDSRRRGRPPWPWPQRAGRGWWG